MVHKGHDGAAALDEPPAKVHIGDVGKLVVRDIEQAGQLRPVCGGLVEKHQKLTVGEHEPGRLGAQALLHILRGGGQGRAVLAKPLPCLVEELGGVVILEKQVG